MPYRNGVGMLYDGGRYENMDWAMEIRRLEGLRAAPARACARRAARPRARQLRQILDRGPQQAKPASVLPEGRIDVVIGTQSTGQGHRPASPRWSPTCSMFRSRASRSSMATPMWSRVEGGTHSGRSMRHAATVFHGRRRADQKGQASPPSRSTRRRPTWNSTTAVFGARTPTALSISSSSRAETARLDLQGDLKGRGRSRHRQRDARSRYFPTAAPSARSRWIRRPAR